MKDQTMERWYQLCALAAIEDDPAKLLALVTEVNRLLTEREKLLTASQSAEMRKTWRDLAREIDLEQDVEKMLTPSADQNQALLGEERAKVPRRLGRTASAA